MSRLVAQALRAHVEDVDIKGFRENDGMGNFVSKPLYVNESGMYALIFGSKKPEVFVKT
jgi:hypothetical protein